MRRRRKTLNSFPIYCPVHKVVHWMRTEDIAMTMHIYQSMVAEITFAAPMPYIEGISTPSVLLDRVLCPQREKDETAKRSPLHHKLAQIMVTKAIILTETILSLLPSTTPRLL